MLERLLDVEQKERWRGSRALVVIDRERCPACDSPTTSLSAEQLPLLRHAGYGASERSVMVSCVHCPWTMVREVSEVRPP